MNNQKLVRPTKRVISSRMTTKTKGTSVRQTGNTGGSTMTIETWL